MISRRLKRVLLGVTGLCVVLLPFVSVRASKTIFYPQECIGDWGELQNAQGKPDSKDVQDISEGDAAESNRVGSRIVCSQFDDTSLSNVRPTFVELALYARPIGGLTGESTLSRLLQKYSTHAFAEDETSASTTETVASTSEPIPEPSPIITDAATSTDAETPEVIIPAVISSTTTNDEVSSTTPSVDDTAVQEETENISPTTTSEVVEGGVVATTTEESLEVKIEAEPALSAVPEIEVQASFDGGESWTLVGNSIVSGTEALSMTVPLYLFKTGDDISKMSVRIIKTAGSPEVLLDGMSLAVSFVPLTEKGRDVVLADIFEKEPDFSTEHIVQMINTSRFQVIATENSEQTPSLWVYVSDAKGTSTPFLVATEGRFSNSAPIATKDGIVFWANGADELYGFRVSDRRVLVPLSVRQGESGESEFMFSETPWKVVLRGGLIQFFSADTGEVAGDDDGSLRQMFYSVRLESKLSTVEKESLGSFGVETSVAPE